MFKRILALALTILFICFKCLTWVPTAAATGIPAFDAFYYAILQTLGMAYTNGVEMDLAPTIADIRENMPDYLQQPDNAIKYLLRDYAAKIWENSVLQWSDSANEPAAVSELSAIRLASSEVSTPTLKDIVAQYQRKALDNDYDIVTPINTDAIAFWNHYDSSYINQYLNLINSTEEDIVVPEPDLNYETYLNRINGRDHSSTNAFYWWNYPSKGNPSADNYYYFTEYNPFTDYSFFVEHNNIISSGDGVLIHDIITLNITSVDGVYSFSTTLSYIPNCIAYYNSGILTYYNDFRFVYNYNNVYFSALGASYPGNITLSSSGTLDNVLNYISNHFRNVNIYVDGVLWSTVEDPVVTTFSSTVPNAVIDTSTDDGKIVSNPIYWTVDENTGTPIDAQINLDKLIDYLKGVIDGSNSDTSVDYGDLVDAGVIEKQDGTAITDANVIAVPVADAIDDALADNPAIAEPIVAIEDLPPLPDLPPFFPTPDFPEGDPTSGFHGMSVLARIINITNQSLPSEVVLVFYGVVFGAVILGLIKILHK